MTDSIRFSFRNTSLGPIILASTPKGICFMAFGDDQPELLAGLRREFPEATIRAGTADRCPQLDTWTDALASHLDTGAELPDLPLDVRGTDFEMLVWDSLRAIPQGEVLGYSELARKINRPTAVRAVASACGRNRIAVLIPCHRVLRGNGHLGGYRWGLARKQALLEAERPRGMGETPAQAAG